VYSNGKQVYAPPSIETIRTYRDQDLRLLDPGVRRLVNPHGYHVSLTQTLWEMKQGLIEQYEEKI
jgi:nicotinate phosphoribosyltransferase